MRAIGAVLIVLVLYVSCTTGIRKDIPAASWEPIFFESINAVAATAGMQPLREKRLGRDSLEIRVWCGFGRSMLQGIVIERVGDSWQAHYLLEGEQEPSREVGPARSWADVWSDLDAMGILSLPDSSTLTGGPIGIRDGVSYVMEYQTKGHYRTYKYGNPSRQPWPEAERVARIAMLLAKEFSLPDLYYSPRTFPSSVRMGQVVLAKRGKAYGAFQITELTSPDVGQPQIRARIKWVYRTDGKSLLSGDGAVSGELTTNGERSQKFGPFMARWGYQNIDGCALYYSDPAGDKAGSPDREFNAITDLTSFEGLDAADPKWRYKASFVDPLPAE